MWPYGKGIRLAENYIFMMDILKIRWLEHIFSGIFILSYYIKTVYYIFILSLLSIEK